MDESPNADQVARIIVEACKVTGADPIRVASGAPYDGHETPRARAYAALAILELFPVNGSVSIGRMVGAGTPKSYLSSFNHAMRKVGIPWWSDDDFVSIVRKSGAALGLEVIVVRKPQALARGFRTSS